jgi:hypothetical protein
MVSGGMKAGLTPEKLLKPRDKWLYYENGFLDALEETPGRRFAGEKWPEEGRQLYRSGFQFGLVLNKEKEKEDQGGGEPESGAADPEASGQHSGGSVGSG